MSGFGLAQYGLFPYGSAASPTFVGNFAPFVGSAIARLDIVEFDVTNPAWVVSETALRVTFANGTSETAWTEARGFAGPYWRGSSRTPVDGGYHYVLRRTGGWPGSEFRVDVTATDLAGGTVSGQS